MPLNEASFADLLFQVRTGNPAAADVLVRRYESAVRVAVRVRLTDPDLRRLVDSVDVCQSVMASFFARIGLGQYDLQNPEQLLALLTRMARNKLGEVTRYHRAERRDGRRTRSLPDAPEPIASDPGPPVVIATRDLLAVVRSRLSPDECEIADGRAAGLGWAEIAAELGGTADQRRVQFKRAIDRVTAELGLPGDG